LILKVSPNRECPQTARCWSKATNGWRPTGNRGGNSRERRRSMRRMRLIEIHEQAWCPDSLRDALTDYLQFAIESGNPYGAIVERLKQSVLRARATRIVDLCSGGGGPWRRLHREFAATNFPIEVCLTDKYPNLAALRLAQAESGGRLSFH